MRLNKIYCLNKQCEDYRKRGNKNISVAGHYGKNQYRLLRCRTCGLRFSERRWTIFFGLHTDENTIKEALISLLGGKSIRKTAEDVGLDKDTVQRIWKRVIKRWESTIIEFLEEINLHDVDFKNLFSSPIPGIDPYRPVIPWRTDVNAVGKLRRSFLSNRLNKKRKRKTDIYWLSARVEGAK